MYPTIHALELAGAAVGALVGRYLGERLCHALEHDTEPKALTDRERHAAVISALLRACNGVELPAKASTVSAAFKSAETDFGNPFYLPIGRRKWVVRLNSGAVPKVNLSDADHNVEFSVSGRELLGLVNEALESRSQA
jgi:hypothetical protein